MNITTLENGDRKLELSEYERDILVQVITHLRDHYDDLEFSIQSYTLDQVNEAINLLDGFQTETTKNLSNDNIILLKNITASTTYLIDESFFDDDENLYEVSSDFSILLRKNIQKTTQ